MASVIDRTAETGTGLCFNEQDVRRGCNGMCPFNVDSDLLRPAARFFRQLRAAKLVYDTKRRRIGQPKRLIEDMQVVDDRRIVPGVHNCNRLPSTVANY